MRPVGVEVGGPSSGSDEVRIVDDVLCLREVLSGAVPSEEGTGEPVMGSWG